MFDRVKIARVLNIYLFKVNNGNTNKSCEICSKLSIKTPERRTNFTPFSSVSIVDVEQVNGSWELFCGSNNDL